MPETIYRLSATTRRVLYYLTDHSTKQADGSSAITITVANIAAATKCTVRSVRRCLRRLEALGYISTFVSMRTGGEYNPNTYVIHPINQTHAEQIEELREKGVETEPLGLVNYVKSR
jgi:hypothetical protein